MKKIVLLLLLLAVLFTGFSQPVTKVTPMLKSDYLKKSKNQKTAAWILLGGGAAFTVTGYIIGLNSAVSSFGNIITTGRPGKTFTAGTILFFTGTAAMLSSIPLFIASAKNKRRSMAATAFFKMETAPVILRSSFVQQSYPAISVKINL